MSLFSLDFPTALPAPAVKLGFRTIPEDFVVEEQVDFTPAGEGEHLLIHLRKINENTRWVAMKLAEFYGVDTAAVGYCGLKDRRAVTSQWFSVPLPARSMPRSPALDGCEILTIARHTKKLRPGTHSGNRFVITLRGTHDQQGREDIQGRLEAVAREGVPNYFGEQRFGKDGGNLAEVSRILASQRPRFKGQRGGLYLSSARSWLFNQVLASRVAQGCWRDVPDGPLWGRGRPVVEGVMAAEEQEILAPWQAWCLALEHSGLRQERRPLCLQPKDFRWYWQDDSLVLEFELPPGSFATAVLRELAILELPQVDGGV